MVADMALAFTLTLITQLVLTIGGLLEHLQLRP